MVRKISLCCLFLLALTISAQSGVIKDDFRVNNDTTGNTCYNPAVLLLPDNSGIISWHDQRNGYYNIFGQSIRSNGNITGSNFKVSTNLAQNWEYSPEMVAYGDSILVVYQYGWAQWLTVDGTRLGNSFYFSRLHSAYTVDVAIKDTFMYVVGRKYVAGGQRIVMGKYTFSGDLIGDTVYVDDGSAGAVVHPRIATSKNGSIVVVWYDNRDGDYNIYAQMLDGNLNRIGTNFLVNGDTTDLQDSPSIAMDTTGNFVIVWADYRNANKDIYGKRFDPNGNPIGSEFLINDDGSSYYQNYPDVSMDESGNFIVVWTDARNGSYYIYCQLYDSNGNPVGSNFKVSSNTGSEYQYSPSVYTNGTRFIVSWEDARDDRSIYYRVFNSDGTPITSDIKANDCTATLNQYYPSVDMNPSGYSVVAWEDLRGSYNSIYYSIYDQVGNTIVDNAFIRDGYYPDVKVFDDSSFIVVLASAAEYYKHIVYYLFKDTGIDSGYAEDNTSNLRQGPKVAIMPSGKFAIVWYDSRDDGYYKIYAQAFDENANPIGNNVLINDDGLSISHSAPDIAVSPDGKYIIVWYDQRYSRTEIFGQFLDSTGTLIGGNFLISDSSRHVYKYSPTVEYLPSGKFFVVWHDTYIYGQLVDSSGSLVDTNFLIGYQTGTSYEPNIDVSPSGDAIVVWRQFENGQYDIYARHYSPDFTPDTIVKINNAIEGDNDLQRRPSVGVNNDILFFAWEDARWYHGYDIAAKIVDWNYMGVEERNIIHKNNLKLLTPIATDLIEIEYSVSTPATVKISISDLAGRRVKVLNEKISSSLTGRLGISVSDIKPGIYFITMDTGGEQLSRKVILVK